jgi:UDP-N-acetylmuramate dehydrogenase
LTHDQTTLSIQENVSLAPLTTLRVGGAARFFVEAKTENEIIEAVSWADERELPLFILGGGSNLLISDAGFDGLVLKISTKGIEEYSERGYVNLTVQAGENWDALVAYCVKCNHHGFECLSGIPGTVGAAPVQNIGAYGQEVSQTISEIKCYDRVQKKIVYLKNGKDGKYECGFAYRQSIFNTTEKKRYVILAVSFYFFHQGTPNIIYRDLQHFFGDRKPTLQETRDAVLQIRRAKSMVIDENDPNSRSAGSFFKNPIISNEKFAKIVGKAKADGIETVPSFLVDENFVKVPAAWLIEKSGFCKGYKLGNAGISSKHALALVNLGEAQAQDIIRLKEEIQAKVETAFGISLRPEPEFIGFNQ